MRPMKWSKKAGIALAVLAASGLLGLDLIGCVKPGTNTAAVGHGTYPGEEFDRLTERFQARLDQLRNEAGFPGATAAFILADGRSACVATGYADKENRTPMKPDTRMPAGSIGKTFTAAVAISLVHEGKLNLDDKIETWLGKEDWFGRLPNGKDITLRMLLNHSSGLRDHVFEENFREAIHERLNKPDPDLDFVFSPRELVAFVLNTEPLFAAGKAWKYTDTGYILVGMIIERQSGSTYYALLKNRFLRPLKLRLTVPADRRDIPGVCPGYLDPEKSFGLPAKTVVDGMMVFHPGSEWTGGGLVSNPQDLVRWAKVLYEGKAMKKPYLGELLEGVPCNLSTTSRYGLGVIIDERPLGTTYGHSGWFPGWRTHLAYFPEHKIAVAVQVNTDINQSAGRHADALAEVVLAGSRTRPCNTVAD